MGRGLRALNTGLEGPTAMLRVLHSPLKVLSSSPKQVFIQAECAEVGLRSLDCANSSAILSGFSKW
jgi:hypothetical protein